MAQRRRLVSFAAIIAVAGAHCGDAASDPPGSTVGGASDAGARDATDNVDSSSERGDSESGAPAEGGTSHGDGGGGSLQCSPKCSGDAPICDNGVCKTCTSGAGCSAGTPVCDTSANGAAGQCKKVEVVAFYTPDQDMHDRAHAAYARHANVWFAQAAKDQGFFTYEPTTDWSRLTTVKPAPGRIILFLDNTTADQGQQAGFQSYMESGGAWMGFHYSAYNDESFHWDWYFNELLGCGLFKNNSWEPTSVTLRVEDPTHPTAKGLGATLESAPSEWYSWGLDLRTKSNLKILLSVDPSSFPVGTDPNQSWYSGYYPIVWTNTNYKMMYMNMGHERMNYATDTALSSAFDSPDQDKIYISAFKWLGGATE